MNITVTMIGQSIAFFVFAWICMKYVWPPIMQILDERKKQIADGLAAAERGKHEQVLAQERATDTLREAKEQAAGIIAQAQKRATEIVEQAKEDARSEAERIKSGVAAEIEQETNRAREQLRAQVVSIAVAGAGKVLEKEIDATTHDAMLDTLVAQL